MYNKIRYLGKLSLRFFLENELLRDGNYDVITSGLQFYDGSDMSLLIPETEPEVLAVAGNTQPGQVWQSAFLNWVYEDPVPLNPSVVLNQFPAFFRASGVYIDGAFRPTDDPVYPHKIDFLNGRIIFDNPLPLETRVHAEFCYKTVNVLDLRRFNNQFKSALLEQQYSTNPRTASQLVYPSGVNKPVALPIIFIENVGRTFGNYQLGDRSLIVRDRYMYEIWALDEGTRDNLIDLVSFQQRKSFPIINFNIAPLPLSGIFNELNPDFISYSGLALNAPLPGPSFSGLNPIAFRGFIEDTEVSDLDTFYTESTTQQDVFERANVISIIETYPIMPTTPFGLDFLLEGMNGFENRSG